MFLGSGSGSGSKLSVSRDGEAIPEVLVNSGGENYNWKEKMKWEEKKRKGEKKERRRKLRILECQNLSKIGNHQMANILCYDRLFCI